MILTAIRTAYRKNHRSLRTLLSGRLPSFVYDDGVTVLRGEVPIFVFHQVSADSFEPVARFLADNGYRTVDADEYCGLVRGGCPVPERTVHLTFDDGWRSLWSAAYPLLARHGLKATAFIIPGFVPEEPAAGNGEGLCTWRELSEMHESGILDIQSHTMYHRFVPKWPAIQPLGREGWIPGNGDGWPVLSLAGDLKASKAILEGRLKGKVVRHLAYPNYDGTPEAIAASQAAGYLTNYWGIVPARQTNWPRRDPFRLCRLSPEFVFRLPGRGRRPLAQLLGDTWRIHGRQWLGTLR